MSVTGVGKCSNKIRHIVRLRQLLRRWRQKAAVSSRKVTSIPPDVPSGHVAVCVGSTRRRFVIRATYLNHPVIKSLLRQSEEEYGFSSFTPGPLSIPCCDELLFEEILRFLARSEKELVVGSGGGGGRFVSLDDFRCQLGGGGVILRGIGESRPLLSEKTVW